MIILQEKSLNKVLVVLIVISLPVLGLLYKQNQQLSEILKNEKGLEIGDEAYLFEATAINGEHVSIKASNALLIFFNTTCEACEITAPRWQELYEKYVLPDKIKMIGIAREPVETTKLFISKHKLTFPIILDGTEKITKRYRIKSSPQIVLVNQEGKIIYYSQYGTGVRKALKQVQKIVQKI